MNKSHLLRAASSLALVAAMSTAALSQSGGGSPSSGGGATPTPSQTERPGPGSGGSTEVPKSRDGASERPSNKPQASDRAQEKANPKSAVQGDGKGDQRRSRAAEERGKDKGDNPRAASDRGKDKDDNSRAAGDRAKDGKQQSRDSDRDQRRTFGERDGKDGRADRSAQVKDQGKDQRKAADDKRGDAGDRVQISEQKRTTARERFSRHKGNRLDKVNFDIRVGVNVPRNVTLHALPSDVVEVVPEYRSYRYVYVGDQYLIIDPNDYVIVAVIGGDSRTAGRRGGSFTLASEDRVYFRRHVDRGPSIRLGLGGISIGMSLPDSVELRPVPADVVARVPTLRGHRYFFYENEIAIVDPNTREIVYVIED